MRAVLTPLEVNAQMTQSECFLSSYLLCCFYRQCEYLIRAGKYSLSIKTVVPIHMYSCGGHFEVAELAVFQDLLNNNFIAIATEKLQ